MRKRIVFILTMASVLLSGCGEYEHAYVQDWGVTAFGSEINIEVVNAKPGLKSYRIEETDDGIDLIMHYDKKE